MRTWYFISFLFLLISVSCSQTNEQQENVKTIILHESTDILPISSFIKDVDYLELQASDGGITIGEIQDIKTFADDIIIKQRKASEQSFVRFSKSGEFLNEIINNQKVELKNLSDIIEYEKGYAVLADNGIHYVTKSGVYKQKLIDSEVTAKTFFRHKNSFMVINETPSTNFLSEYSKKSTPAKQEAYNERINKWVYTDLSVQGKNQYHLLSSFSNTIYAFRNNKLLPVYQLDGNTNPTLSEVWQNVGDRDWKETMRYIYDTQHVLVRNYLENEEKIFINYWVGSNSTTAIINKKDWETRYYARAVNDIDGGIWDKALYLSPKNELYIPLSAYKISGHKISNKYHKDFEDLQQKMVGSKNPVLMRCTLK